PSTSHPLGGIADAGHSCRAWVLSPFSFFLLMILPPPRSPLFPYTTLFRSLSYAGAGLGYILPMTFLPLLAKLELPEGHALQFQRSEEHTSELQSRENLVCRLLLEKKNLMIFPTHRIHAPASAGTVTTSTSA